MLSKNMYASSLSSGTRNKFSNPSSDEVSVVFVWKVGRSSTVWIDSAVLDSESDMVKSPRKTGSGVMLFA